MLDLLVLLPQQQVWLHLQKDGQVPVHVKTKTIQSGLNSVTHIWSPFLCSAPTGSGSYLRVRQTQTSPEKWRSIAFNFLIWEKSSPNQVSRRSSSSNGDSFQTVGLWLPGKWSSPAQPLMHACNIYLITLNHFPHSNYNLPTSLGHRCWRWWCPGQWKNKG